MAQAKESANSSKTGKSWQFQKGTSGNPSGRPKIPQDVKEAFKCLTPIAIQKLGEIIQNPKTKDSDRLKAIDIALDRGLGKPVQAVDMDLKSAPQVIIKGFEEIKP